MFFLIPYSLIIRDPLLLTQWPLLPYMSSHHSHLGSLRVHAPFCLSLVVTLMIPTRAAPRVDNEVVLRYSPGRFPVHPNQTVVSRH